MNTRIASLAVPPTASLRKLLGAGIAFTGALLLAWRWTSAQGLTFDAPVVAALQGGLLGALATALGALPVLAMRQIPQRLSDALLGFGAGVMLAATAFSLVLPGLAAASAQGYGKWASGGLVSAGLVLGVLALLALDRLMPHAHFDVQGRTTRPARFTELSPRVLLFVLAIALHNIPEGLAVGVAAGAVAENARSLATGIALQDVPEGLVVALALAAAGLSRGRAVLLGAASGLVEPVFAVLGALAVGVSASLLPWGLAFAGGAMLFAVSHEIIPESHRNGHESAATTGLALGFCVMMVLDTALS